MDAVWGTVWPVAEVDEVSTSSEAWVNERGRAPNLVDNRGCRKIQKGTRATIKALPAPLHRPRPYGW